MAYFIVHTDRFGNQWEDRTGYLSFAAARAELARRRYARHAFIVAKPVDHWR